MITTRRVSHFAGLLAVILLALSSMTPSILAQSQTADPSGSCAVASTASIINGQSGAFLCQPTVFGGSTGTWQRVYLPGHNAVVYTINFNNSVLAATAGLTATVPLGLTLPAGAVVNSLIVTSKVAYAGPSVSSMTVSIGDSSSNTAFTTAYSLFTASATTFQLTAGPKATTTAADVVNAYFTAIGANLTVLTAGQATVQVNYTALPSGSIVVAWNNSPGTYVASNWGHFKRVAWRDAMRYSAKLS